MLRKSISIIAVLFLVSNVLAAQRRAVIINDSVVVKPGEKKWYTFRVGSNGGRLVGSFRAEGGSRNDIKVVVMTTEELENYKNGNEAQVYYTTGDSKTVGRFDLRLPEGEYCILFDNGGAIVSNKVVRTVAELYY